MVRSEIVQNSTDAQYQNYFQRFENRVTEKCKRFCPTNHHKICPATIVSPSSSPFAITRTGTKLADSAGQVQGGKRKAELRGRESLTMSRGVAATTTVSTVCESFIVG